MPARTPLIAQIPPKATPLMPEPLEAPRRFADRGTMLLLACLIALTAISFFWAFFLRKRPKGPRGTLLVDSRRHRPSEAYGSSGRRRRRKRKATHPDNFGRNPTLSETGGLPPPRREEPDPPSAAPESQRSA